MRAHELANLLLNNEDWEVFASVDVNEDGKCHGFSIIELVESPSTNQIGIHFELGEVVK